MTRAQWGKVILTITAVWVAFLLLSLKMGWLNHFFYDTNVSPAPGMDFFSVQRGWKNLLVGRSEFDTFHSDYGPYATWLNYHPLLAVVVGAPLTFFSPWSAYWVWVFLSVGLLALSGWIVASASTDSVRRALAVLLLAGSFPAFILLQSGNAQAVLVLAVALVLRGLDGLRQEGDGTRGRAMLLSGLLISLFSKPIVLALVPLLLLIQSTRRAAVTALAVYLPVSLLSLVLPVWNPIAISWAERWRWITHPDAIAATMNIYRNNFVVTRPMMDNAVHWFAMVGVTDFRWLHIDIYSLSALLDGWLGMHTPDALYRIPILLVLEVSILIALVRDRRVQLDATLLVAMATMLLLILSYGVVWEYHYTLVMPIAALLLARGPASWEERTVVALSFLAWLPSLFFFFRNDDAGSLHVQTVLRAERVLPVLAMFLLLLVRAVLPALRSPDGLRGISQRASC